MKNERLSKLYIVPKIILLLAYGYLIVCFFAKIPIDSDYSNLVLEAEDIRRGNFFLNDWNLTGISFITTDLLYFVIGTLFYGISLKSYVIAISCMFVFLIFTGSKLLFDEKKKFAERWSYSFLYLAIAGFPCWYHMSIVRAHTGCVIWAFLGLYILNQSIKHQEDRKKNYWITILFWTLAAMGDSTSLIIVILPNFILSCVRLCRKCMRQCGKRLDVYPLLVSLISVVLSTIADKFYFLIGEANKNDFLGGKIFEPFENYLNKLYIYLNSLFGMFDAEFVGSKLFSISTLFYFLRSCIVIMGFILVVYNIVIFLKNKNDDYVSSVLSVGFILVSILFVITNMSVDTNSARYFAYAPSVFAILIVRFLNRIDLKITSRTKCFCKISIAAISLVLIARSIFPLPSRSIYRDPVKMELIRVLQANGLTNGYGDFWMSSHVTVMSEDTVKVRAIAGVGNGNVSAYKWFCKNSWYEEKTNFVIASKNAENALFGISADRMKNFFGEPEKIIECLDYEIYVYNYDLSECFNGMRIYNLGTEINFATENRNVEQYVMAGLSHNEIAYSWTDGDVLELNLKINESYHNRKINAHFEIARIYNDIQRVKVLMNGDEIYSASLRGEDDLEFNFLAPSDGKINLRIFLPDAISPLELGESTDGRKLALALVKGKFEIVE